MTRVPLAALALTLGLTGLAGCKIVKTPNPAAKPRMRPAPPRQRC
ncbi:hypothetical protein ACFSHQ_25410 [Gemmobacter lanyuensis]